MSAKSAIDPVLEKADQTVDSARETARSARDTVEEGRRAFPELARTAQKAFSDGLEQLREQANSEQFENARLYVVDRVQERPMTATLAALGAGFVLGLLFAGGRR
ncbi:MAG: DUF883 domain-containing protein [Caulobacteraceae bacterium]